MIGLGAAVHESMATDEAAETLLSAQRSLDSVERSLQTTKANLIVRQRALEELQKPDPLIGELETVGLQRLELEAAIGALVEQDAALRQQIAATIEDAQKTCPGHDFDDLALTPTKVIHDAVLQKFDGEIVTLTHSDGLIKLSRDQLPARVKNRLLLEVEEAPPLARTLQAEALAAAAKRGQPAPRLPKPPTISKYETPEWKKYLNDLKAFEARALSARLATQTLIDYRSAINRQRSMAPPGSASKAGKYYAEVRRYSLSQQVAEIDNRIAAARREEIRIRGLKPKPPGTH